jgi:hypothetical protein
MDTPKKKLWEIAQEGWEMVGKQVDSVLFEYVDGDGNSSQDDDLDGDFPVDDIIENAVDVRAACFIGCMVLGAVGKKFVIDRAGYEEISMANATPIILEATGVDIEKQKYPGLETPIELVVEDRNDNHLMTIPEQIADLKEHNL